MTTKVISRFCGLIASTLLIGGSFAQVSEFKDLHRLVGNGIPVKVYQNIWDEFDRQFTGAENVKWSKVGKNFLANFTMSDQQFAVLLNPKAASIYKISYGKEKHLPADIRKKLKRMYAEFSISSAIKVEEADRTIWVIYADDDTTIVSVRVEDNDIEETQRYTKSIPASIQSNIAKQ